jgi:hypothetical protein
MKLNTTKRTAGGKPRRSGLPPLAPGNSMLVTRPQRHRAESMPTSVSQQFGGFGHDHFPRERYSHFSESGAVAGGKPGSFERWPVTGSSHRPDNPTEPHSKAKAARPIGPATRAEAPRRTNIALVFAVPLWSDMPNLLFLAAGKSLLMIARGGAQLEEEFKPHGRLSRRRHRPALVGWRSCGLVRARSGRTLWRGVADRPCQ